MKFHDLNTTMTLCALGCLLATSPALADTSGKKIAFSNNYAGNSWRQAMLSSYDAVAKKAVADKVVKAADVFTTADKAVPTQAAQIQNLILQGYDAIVINASSPDALNGAVKKACDAGIVVVSFDGLVTEPCAYRVVVDFKEMGRQEVVQMAKFQPKGGNLLEIRGLAGTSIDDAIVTVCPLGVPSAAGRMTWNVAPVTLQAFAPLLDAVTLKVTTSPLRTVSTSRSTESESVLARQFCGT